MIHVLAIITANPGQRARVLEAFQANVPAVRAEEGCIEYGAAVDLEGFGALQTAFGPDTFAVIENGRAPRRSRPMRPRHTWPPMGLKRSR